MAPPSPQGRGPGWAVGKDMGNTLGIDMGNTFFLPSLLRRSALRAVERSGECDSTHRGAEPPAGRGATSALAAVHCVRVRYVLYRFAVGACKFSSATSILSRAHSTGIAFPEFSHEQATEIDRPFLPTRLEAHWISDECFPYEAF